MNPIQARWGATGHRVLRADGIPSADTRHCRCESVFPAVGRDFATCRRPQRTKPWLGDVAWNCGTGLVEKLSAYEDWCPGPYRECYGVGGPGAHGAVVGEG